jgi:trans-aconitate methyltransferase
LDQTTLSPPFPLILLQYLRWTAERPRNYGAAVVEAYPARPSGSVLLPFPRLFFVATR